MNYSPNQYTVAHYGNGNTGGSAQAGGVYNENDVVAVEDPGTLTKSKHIFKGWALSPSGKREHQPRWRHCDCRPERRRAHQHRRFRQRQPKRFRSRIRLYLPKCARQKMGVGISIVTFSHSIGGAIINDRPQAIDFKTSPRQSVIVVPDEGYRVLQKKQIQINAGESRITLPQGLCIVALINNPGKKIHTK